MESRSLDPTLLGSLQARLSSAVPVMPWRALIVAGAGLALFGLFVHYLRTSPFVDVEAYYSGAQAARDGGDLYERALLWRDDKYTLNAPNRVPPTQGLPYVYPPAFALALVPLTFLPLEVATTLWFVLTIACLIGTAYVLSGLMLPGALRSRVAVTVVVAAAFAAFQPVRASLFAGQADCLLLLLLALSLTAFASGHDRRSACWLTLAIAIKPTLAILLLFYLWKRAYRPALITCVGSALLLAAPILLLGWRPLVDFIEVGRYWSSAAFAVSPVNQSPYGMLLRLFTANPYTRPILEAPLLVPSLRWASVGVLLLLLAALVGRGRSLSAARLSLEYGLAVVVMLAVAPLSEDVQYMYLVIPFLATASILLARPRLTAATSALLIALAGLYAYLSLPGLHAMKMAYYEPLVAAPKLFLTGVHVYGLAALLVVVALTVAWQRKENFQPDR